MAHPVPARRFVPADRPARGRPRLRKTINTRLLVGTLIAIAVLSPTIYLWYRYQVGRTADAFLEQAESLAKTGDWNGAAGFYYRYLQVRPQDAAIRVRLAEAFDRAARVPVAKSRAIDLYYQALGVAAAEAQPDLRRRLAELLLELGRFASAEEEANRLLAANAHDPQGSRVLALAQYGQFRTGVLKVSDPEIAKKVSDELERALALDPSSLPLAQTLARVYRTEPQLLSSEKQALSAEERNRTADGFVDRAVAADANNPQAHLARYLYRLDLYLAKVREGAPPSQSTPLLAKAEDDLATALKLGPDDLAVVLASADNARRRAQLSAPGRRPAGKPDKELEEAQQHFEHAIALAPADERAYLGLGELHAIASQWDRAIATWELGLEKCSKESILLNSRLAEALIVQGQLDRAAQVLDLLEAATARYRSQVGGAAADALVASAEVSRARWLIKKGDTRTAIPLLRRVAGGASDASSGLRVAYQASMLLGGIYAGWGQWDQAATAYEQAANDQPGLAEPRLAAASAWLSANRPEAAAADCEQALRLDNQPETWLTLAAARLALQARLPKAERNWEAFDAALAAAGDPKAKTQLANQWRIELLKADSLVLRGKPQSDAVDLLRAVEKKWPDSAGLAGRLLAAYRRSGYKADADRVLAKYPKLAEAGQPLPVQQAQSSLAAGKPEAAYDALRKWYQQNRSNLAVTFQLAEMALDLGKFQDAETWEKSLRELEGDDSSSARYCQARRLLAQAENTQDARLAEAEKLTQEIRRQRPAWPAGQLLTGQVLERRGDTAQAVAAYQEAVRLGEPRMAVYERLILLLYQAQRFAEADRYLAQLEDRATASPGLSSLEISSAVRTGQIDRALELARRGAETRSADPLAHLWLGEVLLANRQYDRAEAAFRRSIALVPDNPRPYMALVGLYVRAGKPDRAREVLGQLEKNVKASGAERAFLVAQAHELLGDTKKAEASYHEIERLAPDDAAMQERLAARLLTANPAEAEKALRRALAINPRSATARRTLAALLAERGGETEWQEAQQLLGASAATGDESVLDRRIEAMLLTRRGGPENVTKARQIVEKLAESKTPADGDHLLLAQLYELQGEPRKAEGELLTLVGRANPRPAHLAAYVDVLLRHEASDRAADWLDRLEKLDADSPATVRLRARWLQAQGRANQIEPLVEDLAERMKKRLPKTAEPQDEAQVCLTAGGIYWALKNYPAAERWYRRATDLAPQRYQPLAVSLGAQDRMAEAVALCLQGAKSDTTSRPAIVLVSVLLAGHPSAEDFERAEPLFKKAALDHKDDAALLNSLANIRALQQRGEEACALLRQVLALEPKNVVALNNLATLLAEQPGKEKEAADYVDRAIQLVGPKPALLDTKGTILMGLGKTDQAAQLLHDATRSPDPDPRYHFHLAVAYDRLGEVGKAREELAKARRGELSRSILTATDRKLLADLDAKLSL
jgi:tetratricopeptide (TPR) repeat protein